GCRAGTQRSPGEDFPNPRAHRPSCVGGFHLPASRNRSSPNLLLLVKGKAADTSLVLAPSHTKECNRKPLERRRSRSQGFPRRLFFSRLSRSRNSRRQRPRLAVPER